MLNNFLRRSYPLGDNVEEYGTARQATYENIGTATNVLRICYAYCFSKQLWSRERGSMLRLCLHCLFPYEHCTLPEGGVITAHKDTTTFVTLQH